MRIKGTDIEISDSLVVDCLYLASTGVTELPDGLTVEFLHLEDTPITKLPEMFTVKSLYLENSNITELPDDITVENLYLRNTKITELPKGLDVDYLTSEGKTFNAHECTQLRLIEKNKCMHDVIKNPTEKAIILHQMLWML